ncbi:MAG: polyphosphate kinase 2 [Hyphomonadaceae bacterium]|jgi:polyphosphate kinase 2|nr:polyphosphate kinase 2 [Hyphomonadaceae bacterium]
MGKNRKTARTADRKASRSFDIDDPVLPKAIDEAALGSGGFPYDKKLDRDTYETELRNLQIELVKLQVSVQKRGERLVVLFEGRDAAGKGSTVKRFSAYLSSRRVRTVALAKPTEVEAGQWYFQRYAAQMPTQGEIVLFDRSWYNRAGVERVMGFCTQDQLADFLREAPQFEGMLVRDGIHLFKFYLDIGREMQWKRFHDRRHDPLRSWKITEIDRAAVGKWDDYTKAKDELFRFTHTATSPWTVIRANDKRRTRLEAIRAVLAALDYEGKSKKIVGTPDPLITGAGPDFFYTA